MIRSPLARLALPGLVLAAVLAAAPPAHAQERVLAREDILLYGIGLRVEPATQTVPKDFATIVSAFLQTSQAPGGLPPLAPGAEVRATLRGPSFAQPIELVAAANTPLQIPVLSVPGTHTVENIRLVSNGQVVLYGTPEVARIEVIEKLLVTTVTTRALTADEIRERGIVFDRENFQAYNFTAAFAIDDGSKIDISFPVVLPTLVPPQDVRVGEADLPVNVPQLQSLRTLVPDTLRIQQRIPNLQVVGFTLTLDEGAPESQNLVLPPIPGVIVIPGDIGFLNQFFSVMLMVANVAPDGSNLVVRDLDATIVLPPGNDNVVGSDDDPLRMARRATGEFPRIVAVTQPGADGKLGTGDDITTLGPGQTGNAEYLVEGRREGTHVVEMELSGTLLGLPVGPVPIRGRAAGAVLVRNPTFTLTFTHPDIVNAGEPYTLDVTVTNTSESPANFVSLNLFAQNLSGARLDDEPGKGIEFIAPNDSATVTFRLIAQRTGKVTAATLDSDENVAGRFVLKSGVGEFGVPLSPDSLVLPKEATSLPPELRDATLGLLGRAWAIATAPPAALPKDLSRFSKQVVLDRGVEAAEAGLRIGLGEPLARSAASMLFDYLGSEYTRLADRVKPGDAPELLSLLQRDVTGFDLVRRLSVRGDVFANAIAGVLAPQVGAGASAFHQALAEQMTAIPAHVSVLVTGAAGAPLAFDAALVDGEGRRLGGLQDGKVVKQIPYGDVLTFTGAGGVVTGQLLVIAVPSPGTYSLALTPREGADVSAEYDLSVVLPGADGRLRFAALSNLALADGLDLSNGAAAAEARYALTRAASGGAVETATFALVTDPQPTVVAIRQIPGVDVVGCPLDPNRMHDAGRVVAVLFSEEVTPESVHDRAPATDIVNFQVEGNRVVGVALQPGRRVAYVALREPVGGLVEPLRRMTVAGVQDASGNSLAAQTIDIQPDNDEEAGVVSGQILQADGTPAAFASV
ncbi:MAG: hypothetical protein MUF60_07290, partial [Vicinamibacterales bacterium]|nr:hypothetical protein [Vicinamibacterales bacterium]